IHVHHCSIDENLGRLFGGKMQNNRPFCQNMTECMQNRADYMEECVFNGQNGILYNDSIKSLCKITKCKHGKSFIIITNWK
ncbi:MAG: hypothetical protein ACLUT1_05575, partial [Ruminococcus sp.]